jgi:phage baseplate assembly protein W
MEDRKPATNFLGTGWSFPPTFRKASRGVRMTTGQEDIDRSLEILLSTALGERVMLPNYGSNMEELLFEPIDTGLQTLIFDRINTAILYYEPRIEVEDILLDTERVNEGVLIITVAYRVRATNSRFNFVYPFYLTEGSQVDNPI